MGLQTSLMVWARVMNISEEMIFVHILSILKGAILYERKKNPSPFAVPKLKFMIW